MNRRGSSIFVPVLALLIAATPVAHRADKKPTTRPDDAAKKLGERIVAFCRANMDKQVGDGECASLAVKALSEFGIKHRAGKDFPAAGDYVWGKQVFLVEASGKREGKASDIRPGDIIQYRDVKFEGKRRTGGRGTYTASAAHHTAIVSSAAPGGQTIYILQQNFAGKRVVTAYTIYLQDLKAGWLRFYRPEPSADAAGDKKADPTSKPTKPSIQSKPANAVAEKLLAFSRASMGKKIGNGQCQGLVMGGLEAQHIEWPMVEDTPGPGDYVWGRQILLMENEDKRIGKVADIRPGDVLQFRDAAFSGREPFIKHHTAVIDRVEDADDLTVRVLHQNTSKSGMTVCDDTMHIGNLKSGWVRIYRLGELPEDYEKRKIVPTTGPTGLTQPFPGS